MAIMLVCGIFTYEVSPEVRRVLESAMYWVHCERLDRAELREAEKPGSRYTKEEIAKLRYDVNAAAETIRDIMQKMERLNVPNWVGNGAMYWAKTHDLRQHYMREFFERSSYSVGGAAV